MASGRLGAVSPVANVNTNIFQTTSGKTSTFSLNVVNITSSKITFSVALSASTTPVDGEYIIFNQSLDAYEAFERSGLMNTSAYYAVINATGGCNAVAMGWEA